MAAVSPVLNPTFLPENGLYKGVNQGDASWQLSPTPYRLTSQQADTLTRLGKALWQFEKACDQLYRDSQKGKSPAWIAEVMDKGKPQSLIQYSGMKRLKNQVPLVLRPDLLVTQEGFSLCEIDAVPGGLGFLSAMDEAYRQSGFKTLRAEDALPNVFLTMLLQAYVTQSKSQVHDVKPSIAIVMSDEASDYQAEMDWLVSHIQGVYPTIYRIHPKQVTLVRDQLMFVDEDGSEKPIDLIYRFFELFDLPNIPKMELIQYAMKKGLAVCTPPFHPHLEEKSWLALLHHPALQSTWARLIPQESLHLLLQVIPQGWLLDPAPLPPQAVIPNLSLGTEPVQSFLQLAEATQKQRELVIKPSGFSPMAWGSRGVAIGHDMPQDAWQERLNQALNAYDATPHLLQRFESTTVETLERLDSSTCEITPFKARTRLCPYYLVINDEPVLAGVLATSCPSDKKLIHGMRDAILAPCWVPD